MLVRAVLVVAPVSASFLACGDATHEREVGETATTGTWFRTCETDDECVEGSCLCGKCTIACVRNAECESLSPLSECVDTSTLLDCQESLRGSVCADGDAPAPLDAGPETDDATTDDSVSTDLDDPPNSADGGLDGTEASDSADGTGGTGSATDANPSNDAPDPTSPGEMPVASGEAPQRVDLLFVIDNSLGMADKQLLLSETVPDLVRRLQSPPCITRDGLVVERPVDPDAPCISGAQREFRPITDIHVGLITSSLGGYGAYADCTENSQMNSEQNVDMAHLLGSRERGAAFVPHVVEQPFLTWNGSTRASEADFTGLVMSAGEQGCGWEAPLEAWVRFLVDPYPYLTIERRPCNAGDESDSCAGPAVGDDGELLVDQVVLNQRAAFVRPDSLLSIVLFSDENDCSFRPSGQSWRFAQTINENGSYNPAYKGTAACGEPEYGPNHACCHSCADTGLPPDGCPRAVTPDGLTVGQGCEDPRYSIDSLDDHPNLRCWEQKRRFGVDQLFPVERYVNALRLPRLCPFADDLDPGSPACAEDGLSVDNPLFAGGREQSHIVLAGIVGVPWQDLAVEVNGPNPLEYRVDGVADDGLDWDWILGDPEPADGIWRPEDPLMREAIEPRSGTSPATGEELAGPDAPFMANSSNGHEWVISDNSDLQYACVFPLRTPRECMSLQEYAEAREEGLAVPSCTCTVFGEERFKHPSCQNPSSGGYSATQYLAGAYPSLRQLRVLHDYREQSVVASICPKEVDDSHSPEFAYRPAIEALFDRLRPRLGGSVRPLPNVCSGNCSISECGDGIVQLGESCDDGNAVDDDACRNDCRLPSCGDGIVQQGEACDDGNAVANDGCTNACTPPACGDRIVQDGEGCDDGNFSDADFCLSTCVDARCGDGIVSGTEECDDGNADNTDRCTSDCVLARCGDGIRQTGEACDDGNLIEGDTCSADCRSRTGAAPGTVPPSVPPIEPTPALPSSTPPAATAPPDE